MICPIAAGNSEVTPKSNKPAVANAIASLNRPYVSPDVLRFYAILCK